MPTITFAPGVASSPLLIASLIDTFIFGASITSASATLVTAQSGTVSFELSGTGFTFGQIGGVPVFTGGLVDGLITRDSGVLQVTISNVGIAAVALQNAALQENSGADTAAVENLLLAQNWTYFGRANADVLLQSAVSADGVPINLAGDDSFYGGGGNDDLFLGDGDDLGRGGIGNDRLIGGNGIDRLYGDTGNDRLYGGLGNDTLNGGAGDDTVRGGAGNDELRDEGGSDRFDGGAGVDTLVLDSRGLTTTVFNVLVNLTTGMQGSPDIAGDEDLLISIENYTHLGVFNMTLIGSARDNRLLTDAGIDWVSGLDGNDVISTGALADRLDGGNGNDTLDGGSSADRLIGGNGLDRLFGDTGADRLYGGLDNDRLSGDDGNDRLWGGGGRDIVNGGAGDDQMRGDAGGDTFVFEVGDDQDQILDFELGLDRIDLAPGVAHSFQNFAGTVLVNYGPGIDSVLLVGIAFADAGLVTVV